MPGRIVPLVNGEYYHLFNRGINKQDIFNQPRDYRRFLHTLHYYQFSGPKVRFSMFTKNLRNNFHPKQESKLVEIICYCLMPNHFHLVVKQLQDNGTSIFMSQLLNSYTKFFNTKYNKIGPLLQGTFKSVHVETSEQLIHLSRYIHLNPVNPEVASLVKNPESYTWSSYKDYLAGFSALCLLEPVLELFPSPSNEKYREFVEDYIDYANTINLIKHQLIDTEV